jgi:hypothetical protein
MRRITALTSVLVVLAVGSGGALAARHPSKHDRGHSRVHVLKVHRNAEQAVELDLDHSATPAKPAPDSIGDEHVVTADFYQGTKHVGFDGGVCTLVRAPSWFHCLATNNFAKGSLTVQFLGDFSSSGPYHFAITGGTGAYRGARGEVLFIARANGEADVTYTFTTVR